ncbi:hypothetical protein BCR35DRAFT_300515 [Leucosporidium creatinivorum]|uniref:Uncharacterized protein n=1 Tax=Leucosporidium creatinivorum TaxID=106004 RepID=A0A1Y2G1G3_9BASI|nr:hypothetical protein BCR35DRAFT_300515 [Leucosporidium creatinivorum]
MRKQLRADAQRIRREWQREMDKTQFWSKPKFAEDPRFKPLLTLIHSIDDRDSLRRADAQSQLDGAARWLRGKHDASNAWLDKRPSSPTEQLSTLSLSDAERPDVAARPYPTRTSSLAPPSPAAWTERPMSRGRSLNTVPQARDGPLGRDMLKRRSNSVDGAAELELARSPSRLEKVLGRRRSKSRPRRVEGSQRMVLD